MWEDTVRPTEAVITSMLGHTTTTITITITDARGGRGWRLGPQARGWLSATRRKSLVGLIQALRTSLLDVSPISPRAINVRRLRSFSSRS
jgi:hypothetical protein